MPIVEGVRIKVEIDGDKVAIKSLSRILKEQKKVEGGAEDVEQQAVSTSQSIQRLGASADDASGDMRQFSAVIGDSAPNQLADFRSDILRTSDAVDDAGAKMQSASGRTRGLATSLSQIASDSPFGVLGIANNVEQLVGQLQAARSAGLSFKQIAASLFTPGALLTIGAGVVSALAVAFGDDLFNALFKSNQELKAFESALSEVLDLEVGGSTEEIESQIQQFEESLAQLREEEQRLDAMDSNMVGRGFGSFRVFVRENFIPTSEEYLEQSNALSQADVEAMQSAKERREEIEKTREAVEEQIRTLEAQLRVRRRVEEFGLPTQDDDTDPRPTIEPPERPELPRVQPEDQLIDAEAINFDEELNLGALAEMELRLQTIQRLQRDGILTGIEADRQRLQAVQTALQRLQQEAAAGGDVGADTVRRLREEVERLQQQLQQSGQEAASATESAFAQGIARGAAQGFQQGFRPLLNSIESDVAKALINAMLQALSSAVAKQLADLLSGDGEGGEGEGLAGQLLGGLIGTGLSLITGGLFADGGYTGKGGRFEPAGIVHKGEFVVPKDVVDRTGPEYWARMAGMPGYADGGFVQAVTRPAVPRQATSSSGLGSNDDLIGEMRRIASEVARIKQNPAPTLVSRRDSRRITDASRDLTQSRRDSPPRPNGS